MAGRDPLPALLARLLGRAEHQRRHEQLQRLVDCDRRHLCHLPDLLIGLHDALDARDGELRADVHAGRGGLAGGWGRGGVEAGGGKLLILYARAAGGTRHAAGGRGVVGMAVVGVVREGSFRLYGMRVVEGAGGCVGV